MRLLLDTHVFLWWAADDPHLSAPAHAAIAAAENAVFVSAATAWEIAIKASLGRLRVPEDVDQFLARELQRNGFVPLPVDFTHALGVRRLPDHNRDPFDRLLLQPGVRGRPDAGQQ